MTLHTGMLPNLRSLIHAGNPIGDEADAHILEPEDTT
jgi:hypothetical protein